MRRLSVVGMLVVAASLAAAGEALANSLTVQCTPGGPSGQCDESGTWQRAAVSVTWLSVPTPTEVTGCYSQTYAEISATVSCEVWWGPQTSQSISFPLNVDAADPVVTPTPSRPPDQNGWYNHPVTVSFDGSAFSSIASCTDPVTYSGPDTSGAVLTGTCTSVAGNTASASLSLRYDATPPTLDVTATPGDRSVMVHWRTSTGLAPLASLLVVRTPGLRGAAASVLPPQSAAGSYDDSRVRTRVRYRYTLTATDQAGNVTVQSVVVRPGPQLLTPASEARLSGPPLLSWTAVPRATYYNVQLFRGRKVLSAWPSRARLQLERTWRFGGRLQRLRPGRYQWYVWPGFGSRASARYGRAVGSGVFVVT